MIPEPDLERRLREALEALAAMPPEQRPAPHQGPSRFAIETPVPVMTPAEVAALKNVTVQAVRAVLQDERRRAHIFPSATYTGEGKRRLWTIPADEAHAWQPWRGKGDKRKKEQE